MTSLANQTVLVVGGTSGIGYAVAERALAEHASKVIVASSSQAKVDATVKNLSEKSAHASISGSVVNARDAQSIKALFESVGEIDHLVWTSGDKLKICNKDTDLTQTKDLFDVRFCGPAMAMQVAQIKSGGSATLTIGSAVKKPVVGRSLVSAVTGATDALTRGLALDYAPIRVNVICPGLVKTELWDELLPKEQQEKMFEAAAKRLPVGFCAVPEDIADAYMFVMKCKYITGQRIEVDGGTSLV